MGLKLKINWLDWLNRIPITIGERFNITEPKREGIMNTIIRRLFSQRALNPAKFTLSCVSRKCKLIYVAGVCGFALLLALAPFAAAPAYAEQNRFTDDVSVDGNVGIGTTAPTKKLEVSGDAKITNALEVQGAGDTYIAHDLYFSNATASQISSNKAITIISGSPGTNSNLTLQGRGTGIIYVTDALTADGIIESTTGGIKFPDGTTQTSAGAAGGWVDDGTVVRLGTSTDNVGIGTTGPGYKLDVQGGDVRVGTQAPGHASASPDLFIQGNLEVDATGYIDGGLLVLEHIDVQGSGSSTFTGNITVSGTGASSFAGNVGIGTTNPEAKLEVAGDFIRTIAHVGGYAQADGGDNNYVAGRSLVINKKKADTAIRVSYTDNMRVYGTGQSCRWEIRFDGASCPGQIICADVYNSATGGNLHHNRTLVGYCAGLAAGNHTVTVYVGSSPGYSGCDCYTGWQQSWSLEAEEVR